MILLLFLRGERNYHIFYYLYDGLQGKNKLKGYCLDSSRKTCHRYLSSPLGMVQSIEVSVQWYFYAYNYDCFNFFLFFFIVHDLVCMFTMCNEKLLYALLGSMLVSFSKKYLHIFSIGFHFVHKEYAISFIMFFLPFY